MLSETQNLCTSPQITCRGEIKMTRGHEEILVGNGEAFFFPLELLFPGGDPLGPPFACGAFVSNKCKLIYEL